jgi:hypothetical protein
VATLWLDDIRPPWQHGYTGATWIKTADECIACLEMKHFDFASLDHDLSVPATMGDPAPDEKTGYTVVLWLEANPEFWPKNGVRVHSQNPVGKGRMNVVIQRHYGRVF